MIDPDSIAIALGRLDFLRDASSETLRRLADLTAPVRWETDHVIFREGDRGTPLHVIERGRVAVEIAIPGRGRATIMTLGPGDILGWSSFFQDQPKDASARAVCETHAWAIDAAGLRLLCDADHDFGYDFVQRLLHELSQRLKQTRMQLLDLFAPASSTAGGAHR